MACITNSWARYKAAPTRPPSRTVPAWTLAAAAPAADDEEDEADEAAPAEEDVLAAEVVEVVVPEPEPVLEVEETVAVVEDGDEPVLEAREAEALVVGTAEAEAGAGNGCQQHVQRGRGAQTAGGALTRSANVLHKSKGGRAQRCLPARQVRRAARRISGRLDDARIACKARVDVACHRGGRGQQRVASTRSVKWARPGRIAALQIACAGGDGLRIIAGSRAIDCASRSVTITKPMATKQHTLAMLADVSHERRPGLPLPEMRLLRRRGHAPSGGGGCDNCKGQMHNLSRRR
ncbi:hypothetical protein ANO11243_080950 [Dothideomycetidae sp. 11243]|nr:hypothetical protein ANO11243_080950 [fungal sp. No.11243]